MKINSKYTVLLVVKFLYFSRFFIHFTKSGFTVAFVLSKKCFTVQSLVLPYSHMLLLGDCFIFQFFKSSHAAYVILLFIYITFLVLISYDLRNIVKIFLGSFCVFIFFLTVIEVILVNTF